MFSKDSNKSGLLKMQPLMNTSTISMTTRLNNFFKELQPIVSARVFTSQDNLSSKDFWTALFNFEVDRLKKAAQKSIISPEAFITELYNIQAMIGKYTVSPYDYALAVRELLQIFPLSSEYHLQLKAALKKYYADLTNENEAFLLENFEADIIDSAQLYLSSKNTNEQWLIKTLSFYRKYIAQDTFYFKVAQLECLLKRLDAMPSTKFSEEKIVRLQSALQRRIIGATTQHQVRYLQHIDSYLKKQLQLTHTTQQELIYKHEQKSQAKQTSLTRTFQLVTNALDYAIKHPIQTITLVLATQTAAAAAMKPFSFKCEEDEDELQNGLVRYSDSMIGTELNKLKEETAIWTALKLIQQQKSSLLRKGKARREESRELMRHREHLNRVTERKDYQTFVGEIAKDYVARESHADHKTQFSILKQDLTNLRLKALGEVLENSVISTRTSGSISTVGNEFRINPIAAERRNLDVARLSNGNFLVAWQEDDGDPFGIFAQLFDGSDLTTTPTPIGSSFQVNTETMFSQSEPSVAALENGNFVVVWSSSQDSGGTDRDVLMQLYNGISTTEIPVRIGGELQVHSSSTGFQTASTTTSVAGLTEGYFVVAWHDEGNSAKFQLFDSGMQGSPIAIGDEVTASNIVSGLGDVDVTRLNNGNFLVTWNVFPDDIHYGRMYDGSQLTTTPSPISNEFVVNNPAGLDRTLTIPLDNDRLIAVWDVQSSGGTLFGQNFDASSLQTNPIPTGSTFQFASSSLPVPYISDGTALDAGRFLITWRDFDAAAELFVDLYNANTATPTLEGSPCLVTVDGQRPALAQLTHDTAIITWQDNDSVATDIFGRLLTRGTPNTIPTLNTNMLAISQGETVTIDSSILDASDAEENDASVVLFCVSDIQRGQFAHTSDPDSAITSFTQAQINRAEILFTHDGSEEAPSYVVVVTDRMLRSDPSAASIDFTLQEDNDNTNGGGGSNNTIPIIAGVVGGVGALASAVLVGGGYGFFARYKKGEKWWPFNKKKIVTGAGTSDQVSDIELTGISSSSSDRQSERNSGNTSEVNSDIETFVDDSTIGTVGDRTVREAAQPSTGSPERFRPWSMS